MDTSESGLDLLIGALQRVVQQSAELARALRRQAAASGLMTSKGRELHCAAVAVANIGIRAALANRIFSGLAREGLTKFSEATPTQLSQALTMAKVKEDGVFFEQIRRDLDQPVAFLSTAADRIALARGLLPQGDSRTGG